VVLAGAMLLGLALSLASRATSLIQFQLSYGILVGLAASAFCAPMIAAATAWFEENRSAWARPVFNGAKNLVVSSQIVTADRISRRGPDWEECMETRGNQDRRDSFRGIPLLDLRT